jgi:hypothetical protein
MKRFVAAAVCAVVLSMGSSALAMDDTGRKYEDAITHPLRMAAYLVNPAGFALEWLVRSARKASTVTTASACSGLAT